MKTVQDKELTRDQDCAEEIGSFVRLQEDKANKATVEKSAIMEDQTGEITPPAGENEEIVILEEVKKPAVKVIFIDLENEKTLTQPEKTVPSRFCAKFIKERKTKAVMMISEGSDSSRKNRKTSKAVVTPSTSNSATTSTSNVHVRIMLFLSN